jgi:predicted 2-oxoglutarate/Fe(II)-dependent dioxygenase YbiX
MQIPLNDESDYTGGRVTYVTDSGLVQPRRQAGSATVHDCTIAHGVTELTAGVRYSLFLLTSPATVQRMGQ